MAFKFEIPEDVKKELEEQEKAKEKEAALRVKNKVVQFPLPWTDEKRAAPSAILRSALFGIVRRGRRAYLENAELVAWGSTQITYTGQQLMQSDQDVWMACVEACKRQGKSEVIISQRELIRLSGRKSSNTERLWNDLKRLNNASIEINTERYVYLGNLIHDAVKDKETGHIALSINPKMLALFGGSVTHIDVEQRAALKMDLAKWLQGYVNSHKSSWRKPHLIGLEKLQALCGSETPIREFRRNIKKALDELKDAEVIAGYNIEKDILKVWKK